MISMEALVCQASPSLHAKASMKMRRISVGELLSVIHAGGRRSREGPKKIRVTHHGVNVVYIPKPCHYYVISASRR